MGQTDLSDIAGLIDDPAGRLFLMSPRVYKPKTARTDSGGKIRRRQGTGDHLTAVMEMTDAAFNEARALVRLNHPEYSDEEVHLATIRHRVGDEVFKRAYPDARFGES